LNQLNGPRCSKTPSTQTSESQSCLSRVVDQMIEAFAFHEESICEGV